MRQLSDYSGQLRPNIRLKDFSRGASLSLLQLYCWLFMAIDAFWYLAVKERFSDEDALACDMWAWERMSRYELDRITNAMKIQGNDVVSLIKALQLEPWMWNTSYTVEVKGQNHVLLTFVECPVLNALEKEGEGREENICKVMEPKWFRDYADYFNPSIQIKALKLPPRRSKEEVACIWEFKVAE
jgi:hypothetical protein